MSCRLNIRIMKRWGKLSDISRPRYTDTLDRRTSMPVSTTYIDIVLAVISLISCVTSVVMATITIANSKEIEFYSRKDKVRIIRNEIMKLARTQDDDNKFIDDFNCLKHDYLDELDGICKRFPKKMIFDSDIKNDLIFVKGNPQYFIDIGLSPHLKEVLSKVE